MRYSAYYIMDPIIRINKFVEDYIPIDKYAASTIIEHNFIDACIQELNLSMYNSDMIYKLINLMDVPNNFIISTMDLRTWNIIDCDNSTLIDTYKGIENIDWMYRSGPESSNGMYITLYYFNKIITIQGDNNLIASICAIYVGIKLLKNKLMLQVAQNTTFSALDAFANLHLTNYKSLSESSSDNDQTDNQEYFII